MAGAIRNEGNQVLVVGGFIAAKAAPTSGRRKLLQEITEHMHHFNILPFVVATDVVGLPHFTLGNYRLESPGMIFHIKPVSDLITLAVHGQRFSLQGIEYHQRNELLGKVVGAVVVRAIGEDHRQAIGAMPGPYQVVGAGLAGRIGRAGRIGGLFGE